MNTTADQVYPQTVDQHCSVHLVQDIFQFYFAFKKKLCMKKILYYILYVKLFSAIFAGIQIQETNAKTHFRMQPCETLYKKKIFNCIAGSLLDL